MWLSTVLSAASDAGTVVPVAGGAGAGLVGVLWYLLLEERKERRALQERLDALVERLLPVMTASTAATDRMVEALASQIESHERKPSDPRVLERAYDQLRDLLDEYGDPPPPRRRREGR